ncbi:putative phosphomutase (TIGR03848 family) [Aeromicrobium panaciterrae]|uniref:Phosphomutase (TIGR03848 family) n=1 Tax=Aeromicrobium panaciterrae TaxID=363861 RepID=A0ABU1UMG9_9ACTN|nr:histidine phosphatase family protein [Aeromicrobium panaciterrae]MDR7086362.1 putative phosphomutase (TIGR03848 family) [Aeromicrobium panaciterrae]
MATVILVRHGRTTANASGLLAGRTPGIQLDEVGHEQVARTGERLGDVPLVGIVTSPLKRCRQTSKAIVGQQANKPKVVTEKGITECDYGDWQGRSLSDLAKEDLWSIVQNHPAAAAFPGGESMATMQARAVEAIRRHDAAIEAEHGAGAVWAAVSHGDIIKAILADALGMHLDLFQRINVDPASASIIRYTSARPYVVASNTHAGDLSWMRGKPASEDAPVGGGAGHAADVATDS